MNCIRLITLSLGILVCISTIKLLQWRHNINKFDSLNFVNILKCEIYPTPSYLKRNKFDEKILINDSTLPSVCVKTVSNNLSWSAHPEYCTGDIFLVWLIKSSIYRNSLRKNIRQFWAQDVDIKLNGKMFKTRRIFLLGSDPQNASTPSVRLENQIYNDILQGTFADTFKSVTQKVVLGMKFVNDHCASVQYVAVVDDDATVVPWNLFQHLPVPSSLGEYFGGFFIYDKKPIRDKRSRWYVPVSDWRCKHYPTYPLGTGFYMSKCTMDRVYDMVLNLYLFGMDDVLFGGIVEELKIRTTEISFTNQYAECSSLIKAHHLGSMKNMVMCHGTDYPDDQQLLWSEFCHAPVSNPSAIPYHTLYCKSFL